APGELTEFDHYLTARWRLYSRRRRGLRYALADHDPWPLHRADVAGCRGATERSDSGRTR
ncbi:MAG: DUF2071 domain-containing protein, partial [Actinomycetota bacterium]|nr:DUF2071 domain-containing protein [Actinomycetota bacterium]